jgi:methyltransferase (TIGR00027 family)
MAIHQESRSALSAASVRAYHHTHDSPKIFDDPVAPLLLTAEEEEFFANVRVERLKRLDPVLAESRPDRSITIGEYMRVSADAVEMLSRARYAEDQLTEAVNNGVRQYVSIGAGMDSFAFRQHDLNQYLQVFEIDRPSAQAFKIKRLKEVGLKLPMNLHFVPVDFTQENIDVALKRSVHNPQVPTFFGWLGSIPYLDSDTVWGTMRAIKEVATQQSQLVFDYIDVDGFDPAKAAPRMQELVAHLRRVEPLCCGFEPEALAIDLERLGWHIREHLSPSEIEARYFSERTDGYHATEHVHFVSAMAK